MWYNDCMFQNCIYIHLYCGWWLYKSLWHVWKISFYVLMSLRCVEYILSFLKSVHLTLSCVLYIKICWYTIHRYRFMFVNCTCHCPAWNTYFEIYNLQFVMPAIYDFMFEDCTSDFIMRGTYFFLYEDCYMALCHVPKILLSPRFP